MIAYKSRYTVTSYLFRLGFEGWQTRDCLQIQVYSNQLALSFWFLKGGKPVIAYKSRYTVTSYLFRFGF